MKFIDKIILLIVIIIITLSFVKAELDSGEGYNPTATEPSSGEETTFDSSNPNNPDFWSQDHPDLSKVDNWNEVSSDSINKLQDSGDQQEAINNKYNIELNLKGQKATISGNNLELSDGSQIDLNTGKSLTVETDGSKVTYFDDEEGTTCLNCEGLT